MKYFTLMAEVSIQTPILFKKPIFAEHNTLQAALIDITTGNEHPILPKLIGKHLGKKD